MSTVDRIDFEPLLAKVVEEKVATDDDLCITVEIEYLEVVSWDEGIFLTFEHPAEPMAEIASFLSIYFETILNQPARSSRYRVTEKYL